MSATPDPDTVKTSSNGSEQEKVDLKPADMAVRWADYAKAAIIYPPGSSRVERAFDAFKEALKATAIHNRVPITMSLDKLGVGREIMDITEDSKESWLRDRMRSGALDGVVFHVAVEADTMMAFTKRLADIHLRKGASEEGEELWPEHYRGIDLVHREFDGSFKGNKSNLVHGEASKDEEGNEDLLPGFEHEGLVDRLSLEGGVSDSVARISEQLSGSGMHLPDEIELEFGSKSVRRLLRYVVQCIPEDERESYNKASTTARSILGGLENMLQEEGQTTESVTKDDSVDLQALVFAASRMIFSREPSEITEEDLPDRGKGGHKGDDEITDDLSSLLLEINGLPKQRIEIDDEVVDDHAEQLRVYFHYLARPVEGERLDTIYDHATRLLQECRDREKAAIRDVLADVWHRADDVRGRRRVIEFFTHAKKTRLLRECGALPPEYVQQSFPRDFGIYLDGIDPTDAGDRSELLEVIRGLDAAKISGVEAALISGPESLGHPGRAQAILALKSEAALPFVGPLLALEDAEVTPALVRYLRDLGAGNQACVALEVLGEFGRYSDHYLRDCARSLMSGAVYPGVLVYQADMLSTLVGQKNTEPHQRVRAIHGLGALGTNDAKRRLKLLLKRRFGLFPVEPLNIRQAARSALIAMENRRV
ncbi:MAG: hypothetical protein QNJ98_02170 [Planctomycetota bacterium]|nr:hypothetical protein [Planctomycetota bacterium]